MKGSWWGVGGPQGGRVVVLAVLLVLQVLCAVFFAADVFNDWRWGGYTEHTAFETIVALALVVGVVFGGLEMRRHIERARRAETAASAASGAFVELIDAYFERWGLTSAESDVALLALKGLDVAEISNLRGTAAGTVRAQLAHVYAKAGVTNRTQLVALFIEDLLAGPITKQGD